MLSRHGAVNSPLERVAVFVMGIVAVAALFIAATDFLTQMVAALAGIALLIISIGWPKFFAGLAITLIVVGAMIERYIPAAGAIDEAVVLVALVSFVGRRLASKRTLVVPPGTWFFIGFAVFGLVSSAVNDVPTTITAQGLLLAVKGIAFAFALAQLDWKDADFVRWAKWGATGAAVILFFGAVNLVIPAAWSKIILGYTSVEYTIGLPALLGPFVHPAAFGRICAVIAVSVFAYRMAVRKGRFTGVLLIAASVFGLLSFRVKTLVSLVVAILSIRIRALNAGFFVSALVLLPVGILVLWAPLSSFIGADLQSYVFETSARSTMSFGSLDVAAHYFPLGAGFGRYGSSTAATYYSPEYSSRGFENVYGLRPGLGEGDFLTDTQWPAILGEAGWIGALLFALGLVRIAFSLRAPTDYEESPLEHWVRLSAFGWLVLFVIESIAAPVFSSSPSFPFAFIGSSVCAALMFARRHADVTQSSDEKLAKAP